MHRLLLEYGICTVLLEIEEETLVALGSGHESRAPRCGTAYDLIKQPVRQIGFFF